MVSVWAKWKRDEDHDDVTIEASELAWRAQAPRVAGDSVSSAQPVLPHPWQLRAFTDLTLVCGDDTLLVHCAMVASGERASRVLRMTLDKPMREATTRTIDLSHLPSACVQSSSVAWGAGRRGWR